MTQPATRIRSEYQPGKAPQTVQTWEKLADQAPSDMAALVQLAYIQALQLRMIKLILIWVLLILPVLAGVALFVLPEVLPKSSGF